MNKKMWFTSLAAAAAFAASGIVLAQSTAPTTSYPPTSTPGAGCTATGNAMRGGNLGGEPRATGCPQGTTAGTAAVAPAPAPATASTSGTATMNRSDDTTSSATASSRATHHTASASSHHMTHVARADRN